MTDQLSADGARAILQYERDTGKLFWRKRECGQGLEDRPVRAWNTRLAGKEAASINSKGYLVINLKGKIYRAHRLVWLIEFGHWPEGQIDHINGDKADNRLSNLRDVTNAENHRNMPLRTDNSSGCAGVYFDKRRNRFQVTIKDNGRSKSIGTFAMFDEAVAARRAAEKQLGYHENHGMIPQRL